VKGDPRGVAALAAALFPARAAAVLARHPGVDPDESRSLLAAPRAERLAALASALRVDPCVDRGDPPTSAVRTRVRRPAPLEPGGGPGHAGEPAAWPVLQTGDVLPFELPAAAPALAQLDASLIELGARAAGCAAQGLSSVLGGEASVTGRLLPGLPEPTGVALVPVELTAIAGIASLAIDRGFAARLAARLAGGPGVEGSMAGGPGIGGPTGALSAAERTVVELAVLGALDAVAAGTGVEPTLAPRLALRGGVPQRPLCVELTVSAGGTRGRVLLLLPESALRALRGPPCLPPALRDVPVRGTVRIGETSLEARDAEALGPGDVLLLEPAPGETATLRLAGGLAAQGRISGDALEVTAVDLQEGEGVARSAPVLLEVELAAVAVPLREVARIAAGVVLPLGLDRSGRVTLRIGGRAVAVGELVEVDGGVGVRVVAMAGEP
jgi:type III secretion protein Q